MRSWARHPVLYEINTLVWLHELGEASGRAVTLATIPAAAWDDLAALGIDAVWLMGVWERSPAGRRIALDNPGLIATFVRALPDFSEADATGSPYCVRRFVADARVGGPEGLAAARRELARRGIRLVLDFVPNHLASDHSWVSEHPEYFVRGDRSDLRRDPGSFLELEGGVFANGRDPYFPAWHDVVQVDAFSPGLRRAAEATLLDIAAQCDGVRCDMAMLLMNEIFAGTWGARVGAAPVTEYWPGIIAAVKRRHPEFRFVAEAYWDTQWALQQQGFDLCYDKRLYDRLVQGSVDGVRLHLRAEPAYQQRLLRFIENHDEPRAAAAFSSEKARAAAVVFATLPGSRLFHEGQIEGRRVRLPVFLVRRPTEPVDEPLAAFYGKLLQAIATPALHDGSWRLLEATGWDDNTSFRSLVAWCWEQEQDRAVVVVNLGETPAQARIRLPWLDLAGRRLRLVDRISGDEYERDGDEMLDPGLFVSLPGWGAHLLAVDEVTGRT
jgi:glycosidase